MERGVVQPNSVVASLLTVIAPSKGAEFQGEQGGCLERNCDVDTMGLVSLDYWMMLPLLLVITMMLVIRIKKYLNERQGEGGENLILERAGEVELPAGGGGSGLFS
jgi:hypothetical protein